MDGQNKLNEDLDILARFAEEIPAYLRAKTIFWPMGPNMPQLTLGSYLMRQYRLLLLKDAFSGTDQVRLDNAVAQFHAALDGNIVAFEQRVHNELRARLRQWTEFLRELQSDRGAFNFYRTSVEPRVMMQAILEQLSLPPYKIQGDIKTRLSNVDVGLRSRWLPGDFVWPEEWAAAYPQEDFWYLYGQPA